MTVMPLAQPLFPPPSGYRWELQRNVQIYTDASGVDSGNLNIPPAFDGRTTYTHGANYSLAGAADYELGRWIYAQVQLWVKRGGVDSPTELMAVEPTFPIEEGGPQSGSGSQYVSVLPGDTRRYYSAPPAVWPETFEITYTVPVAPADPTIEALGAVVIKWVGDVWAAVPISSRLSSLNPAAFDTTKAGFRIEWGRQNRRADVALHTLGVVGGLTWPRMWAGEKTYLLDELHLTVTAIPSGGYQTQGTYAYTKLPGTDGTGGAGGTGGGGTAPGSRYAITDWTNTDDPAYLTY